MSPSYLSHPVPQQEFPGATLNWMASKGLCKLQSAMHVREAPPWFSLWHCHIGQLLGHVLGHYLKNQGKPEASAFTCQGFCWHNHGWLEAAWRCRRAWHLDEQVPLSFGGLHLGVAVHSQKPPQADSLLHVLKQIRNKRQEKGWLEPVTQEQKHCFEYPESLWSEMAAGWLSWAWGLIMQATWTPQIAF